MYETTLSWIWDSTHLNMTHQSHEYEKTLIWTWHTNLMNLRQHSAEHDTPISWISVNTHLNMTHNYPEYEPILIRIWHTTLTNMSRVGNSLFRSKSLILKSGCEGFALVALSKSDHEWITFVALYKRATWVKNPFGCSLKKSDMSDSLSKNKQFARKNIHIFCMFLTAFPLSYEQIASIALCSMLFFKEQPWLIHSLQKHNGSDALYTKEWREGSVFTKEQQEQFTLFKSNLLFRSSTHKKWVIHSKNQRVNSQSEYETSVSWIWNNTLMNMRQHSYTVIHIRQQQSGMKTILAVQVRQYYPVLYCNCNCIVLYCCPDITRPLPNLKDVHVPVSSRVLFEKLWRIRGIWVRNLRSLVSVFKRINLIAGGSRRQEERYLKHSIY